MKKDNFSQTILNKVKELGFAPNKNLGQHFLIDQKSLDQLASFVSPKSLVIEVGAGIGQLTERLVKKASRVIAIEIDERYQPGLEKIVKRFGNLELRFTDFLSMKLADFPTFDKYPQVQTVSSLPYQITEPFLQKLFKLPIDQTILVVGINLVRTIESKPGQDSGFGKVTLLVETFFDYDHISDLAKEMFFPSPRIDSAIIKLTPKKEEAYSDRRLFLLRRLFLTAGHGGLAKNVLMHGIIEFQQVGKKAKKPEKGLTKNQSRAIVGQMAIGSQILNKSFDQLNNQELRILSKALTDQEKS